MVERVLQEKKIDQVKMTVVFQDFETGFDSGFDRKMKKNEMEMEDVSHCKTMPLAAGNKGCALLTFKF